MLKQATTVLSQENKSDKGIGIDPSIKNILFEKVIIRSEY